MKKFSRILGVGLTIAMLASVLVVSTPASAGTLTPSNEFSPPTRPGADVVDFSVASNGTTIYAAGGSTDLVSNVVSAGVQMLAKSTNGGTSWSASATPIAAGAVGNLPATIASVKKVVVAPDSADGSWVAIIATDNTTGDVVFISTDGGTTWQSAASPAPGTPLTALDIAGPAGTATHTIAVSSATAVYINEIGGLFGGWTLVTTGSPTWTTADFVPTTNIFALEFSPQYAADRTFAILSNTGNLTIQLANTNARSWNGLMFGSALTVVPNSSTPVVGTPLAADFVLAPTFFGLDATTRVAYVGYATDPLVTNTSNGLFRVSNTLITRLSNINANSVALNTAGDKLVAGAFDSNDVVRVAAPATATVDSGLSATTNKRPAANVAGVNETLVVGFAGTSVLAAGMGAESSVARSANDGMTFNDVSLVDVGASNGPKTFDTSADGAKMYVVTVTANGFVNVWRKTTAWERVLVMTPNVGTADYVVYAAPENGDVVFLSEINSAGNSQLWYTNDGGQTTWQLRFATRIFSNIAVESASTVYALSGNTVLKSTDAGILWDVNPVQNLTFTAATITSLSAGNVLVGGAGGQVAYSTNNTWTTIGPPAQGGGTVTFVTASGLASGNFIYATVANGTNVYRWTVGTGTSWAPMMEIGTTSFVGAPTGIAYASGVLYVTTDIAAGNWPNAGDPAVSALWRTLTPSTASKFIDWGVLALKDTTTPGASVTAPFNVRANEAPQALKATVSANQPKLWMLDTGAANGRLESFVDAVAATGPAVTSPAANFEVAMNRETGNANNVVFQWTAPAGVPATTTYNLQIALDANFTQIVFGDPQAGFAPIATTTAMVGPSGANGLFPFQADTTYYWRVRVNDLNGLVETPDLRFWSAYSASPRSFKIGALAPLGIQAPMPGANSVSVKPTFVWSPVTGATTYEIVVSDDPTFKIITFSRTTDRPNFASDEQLAYGTVYYWRVRASAPATAVTQFAQGIFTTEARPVTTAPTATGPAITVTNVTPTFTVELGTPVEAIPAYLLWIIIGIGAILVIALIVLIVRTRRVS